MPLSITDQTNPHNWWRILRYEQSEFGEGETNVSTKWARLWRTRCHAEGMVKSEESKVYAKREPLWRTRCHE